MEAINWLGSLFSNPQYSTENLKDHVIYVRTKTKSSRRLNLSEYNPQRTYDKQLFYSHKNATVNLAVLDQKMSTFYLVVEEYASKSSLLGPLYVYSDNNQIRCGDHILHLCKVENYFTG